MPFANASERSFFIALVLPVFNVIDANNYNNIFIF